MFALLTIVLLLAAGCSKPKEQLAQTGGEHKGPSALTSEDTAPDAAAGAEAGAGAGAAAGAGANAAKKVAGAAKRSGYAALNPRADNAQARRVGQLIKLQTTKKVNNSWTGVTADTIKLTFGDDVENCGVNIVALASAAGAASAKATRFYRAASTDQDVNNKRTKESIQMLMRYWNDHLDDVANDVPQAVELMKTMNKKGHPFYGRRLVADVVDAGSFQCKDKQTAAALTIRDKSKPFSTVVYDVPGLYENGVELAAAMKAKIPADRRPMIFGLLDTSDYYLNQFAPYAWDEFQSITKMSRLASGWICHDLKPGGKGNQKAWGNGRAINATDPALRSKPRKFGLIYVNSPNSKRAAAEFKGFLKAGCNISFSPNTTEFQVNQNPARASDEGGTIATRLKLSGVTSVIYLIDFLGALFHFVQFQAQTYGPEKVEIGTGWQTNTVQRAMIDQAYVDKSMFYTSFGIQGFGYGPGDPFWVYHTYHKTSPKTKKPCDPRTDAGMSHDEEYCKAPGQIVAWYYSWLPLVGGLIFAGPAPTPKVVTAGLQAYPLTRYGVDGPTTDPTAVLVGAGPGQYYFITDGSSGRWRSSFVSPPPERVMGFPDYPDCQRHYVAWPDKLAPQWEKGGKEYNAWCGNAKYTQNWKDQGKAVKYQPKTAEEDGDTCADAPAGKCETDNYPRWQPIVMR